MSTEPMTPEELERIEQSVHRHNDLGARDALWLIAEVRRLRAEIGQRSGADWQRDIASQLRTALASVEEEHAARMDAETELADARSAFLEDVQLRAMEYERELEACNAEVRRLTSALAEAEAAIAGYRAALFAGRSSEPTVTTPAAPRRGETFDVFASRCPAGMTAPEMADGDAPTIATLAADLERVKAALRAVGRLAALTGSRWPDGEDIRRRDEAYHALKALDGDG